MRTTVFKIKTFIKLCLLASIVILLVPFLIPNPMEKEAINEAAIRNIYLKNKRVGAVFMNDVLGNFELIPSDIIRLGPGENGEPHKVQGKDQDEVVQSMMNFGMNIIASDQIKLNRSIPDSRLRECKYWHYPNNLPSTSVVIVFHNEGFSTLLRTVHSVLNRSPLQFLKEIVLVDDYSDKIDLKSKLDAHVKKLGQKVRLIRNKKREGLIRSRTYGAEISKGEVVLFLDAHCEVNINWLPPLLTPIYENRTTMTVPIIDGIDKDTFEYRPVYQGDDHFRGIFEWGMLYKESKLPHNEVKKRKHHSEPYKSPTHAGGLFAINRGYFLELGGYDPGLLVWGGENFELSFKIWQCGGSIEWVPCSRVGHVYRDFMPYDFGELIKKRKGPIVTINYKRVAEVWMDEYKEYFYTREPMARQYDAGDISDQIALRHQLQCKSFKWYMKNVAYDVLDNFPILPKNLFWGELRSVLVNQCLDTFSLNPPSIIGVSPCHGDGDTQLFRLNQRGQLSVGERCVTANLRYLELSYCPPGSVDGPWRYIDSKMLYHKSYYKCLNSDTIKSQLRLQPCNRNSPGQKWIFKEIVIK